MPSSNGSTTAVPDRLSSATIIIPISLSMVAFSPATFSTSSDDVLPLGPSVTGPDHTGGDIDAVGQDQRQGPAVLVAAKLIKLDRPSPEQPRQVQPGPFRRLGLLRAPGVSPDLRGIDADDADPLGNDLAEPDLDLRDESVAVEHAG